MGNFARNRCALRCSGSDHPDFRISGLLVTRPPVKLGGEAGATEKDWLVAPFGMCASPTNTLVQDAKQPVLCTPIIISKWAPASKNVKIGGVPAIHSDSILKCYHGGEISIADAGQKNVKIKS